MKNTTARGRSAATFVASLALLGGAASLTGSPAQSAEPEGDCTTPYPVADLVDGSAVTTMTVTRGTTPEEFSGTVLGTLEDGIAPGLDMIMIDFGSAGGDTAIDEAGIWQGMSGSPVYAEDGRLIGAVAYGLSWGPSTVAGVTPFEEMDDYLGAARPAGTIAVGDKAARAIARATDVTRAQAGRGFEQLPMPTAFSGLSQKRLDQMAAKGPDYLHTRGTVAAGAASAAVDAGPESLVAGGNLGAALSYGDITAGGVGTVTSVCDGRLVGFGHPMTFGGRTSLGLMPAEAIYVQDDPVGPGFKVANMGTPAGTIDQDRLTGISGSFGATPEETTITSILSYGDRSRTGETASLVPDYNADITFSQILANHDRVVDAIQPGSEVASFSVTGTDGDGAPFDISFTERYTSQFDIAFEGIFEIADIVYNLSQMEGVTIDSVTADGDVTDEVSVYRVRDLEQKRGGEWVPVGRRQKVVVTPGSTLRLRATLKSADGTRVLPINLDVPAQAKRRGYLEVLGGASTFDNDVYRAKTPAAMAEAVAEMTRNDEVASTLYFFKRGKDLTRETTSASQDLVVRGRTWAEVKVRR